MLIAKPRFGVRRRSEKLENDWQRPITDEMLRSEIARMAAETKRAGVLKELWAALGNDPFVIAECLARPHGGAGGRYYTGQPIL